MRLPVELRSRHGGRCRQPLRFGVPFARGAVPAAERLRVLDPSRRPMAAQVTRLATWPDGSVRWALLDLVVDAPDGGCELEIRDDGEPAVADPVVEVVERADGFAVATGALRMAMTSDPAKPLADLEPSHPVGHPVADPVVGNGALTLEAVDGRRFEPTLERFELAERGPLRVSAVTDSRWRGPQGEQLELRTRLSCWAGTGLIRVDVRVRNPHRARHPGNLWDLGDPASVLLGDLSLELHLPAAGPATCRLGPGQPPIRAASGELWIHQESSGGENWDSRNHLNREGRVALAYRGGQLSAEGRVHEILRPSPVVSVDAAGRVTSAAIPRFWQEFPKRLEVAPSGIRLGLFPREHGDHFEIQGGEQKTHTAWLLFAPAAGDADGTLDWVHDPLVAVVPPSHLAASGALPDLVPEAEDPHRSYVDFVHRALEGPRSFFAKREVIDEYGWRSFGDTWADHEDLHFEGEKPVISHYNNQYDLIYGFLLQFARSGDRRWFELASDLGRHVLDIDRYHTGEDKPVYNRGLFWHTEHYRDAGRGTHRSYSDDARGERPRKLCGGGPAAEHNYTSGFLLLHYLTGSVEAAEAVAEHGDWVLAMDDGRRSLLAVFDESPTGLASRTQSPDFHGPGRGAGNSVNALVDAFSLTGERRYLDAAHALVRRVVHPGDDPAAHDLLDVERRWSYTVFFQALAKLLDLAEAGGSPDRESRYARAALLRYADWMEQHELTFAEYRDRTEYPTESWPAQDIRKSAVLALAARYADPADRERFRRRAEAFHHRSMAQLLEFDNCTTTRAFAVLLTAGAATPDQPSPAGEPVASVTDFGPRERFRPQKRRVREQLATPAGLAKALTLPFRPSVLRRLFARELW